MFGRSRKKKEAPRALNPQEDPNSIGNMAIERGYITRGELDEAVRIQRERLPLGEILVELGKLTRSQLEELLLEQQIRRGDSNNRELLRQYERVKMRNRVNMMRDGFKEVGNDVRKLATTVMAASVRANGK